VALEAMNVCRVDRAPHEHHSDGWAKRHGTQWCKLKTELEGVSHRAPYWHAARQEWSLSSVCLSCQFISPSVWPPQISYKQCCCYIEY